MCGIVGYIGFRDAYPILIQGLKRLEYRGYDSAGVALINNEGVMNVYKEKGKVSNLEALTSQRDISGQIGIAHTRWATHGEPSAINAHPHVSQSGRLALVHNGIIENYSNLKILLEKEGYTFKSSTDTEVLVQLIEYMQKKYDKSLENATIMALRMVVGAYAIAVIDKNCPDKIVVARKSSPLVIGIGADHKEFFIASDALPIVEYTKQMVYLNDNEVALLKIGKKIEINNLNYEDITPEVKEVNISLESLEKGGFEHFMLKEIYDQPRCMADCMRGRLLLNEKRIVLSTINMHRERLMKAERFIIVACGTSWHAGLIGKQLIEQWANIPVEVEYASEFRYRNPVISPDDVVIAISQSGETADTLAAFQLAKENKAMCFGIVNVVGSSIARASDTGIYIHVGPEIGVASTKAFTGQVTVLTLFALALGHERGTISKEEYESTIEELGNIPEKIKSVLAKDEEIKDIARSLTYAENALYMGRGFNYPVALEGALKLKEISYIHAEGYPAAEMKHGPIALIDENMPVVFVATHHQLYKKIISNIEEVKARNGRIIAVVTEGDEAVKEIAEATIEVPSTLASLAPLLSAIPLQLIAYHVAVEKGLNVDQPRNLAKSVTVE
ncbi:MULTISPECIES: glutamine--fructose-6-phosphate transaminase (isomerizing) [Prevotellaceae]|jgi:glucosamine--fructose-6-phosphate aminotransferase (isomerizing)|uniref:Glutamine--fructose-6-phosphate aminotransferase [isomerizing] n=1 Tax=Xylanibacter rarus TaxID=1676614 RepID=A0A8E1UR96_9BACT|nr:MULTISPECIES: glutamine--fructose-6-phosphate transaminase (isomerizing) [Prevotellaceae]KOO68779.1 glutamine amidotransferase [Xylanibacter rarus]CCX69373.1 glucosamine--fructose-6-phosphate aminotransferase [isomerizing] [Prevotella sp. CAG:255]